MSTQLAQEQLQEALTTTFLANLAFLNEYDNKLFQRVDSLSQLINKGEFQENYSLEFLMEDGEFDIYDRKNDCYIYNKKPSKFNRNAVNKTDFTSKGSVSILETELFQGKRFPKIFDEVEYFCNFDFSNKKLANDVVKYYDVLENNINDYKYKKYKYINKFMFIGTLLGRHIPLILEKTKARNFFICEQNLEVFRLSLFVVDYSVLAREGRTVVFSIMDDIHTFDEQMEKFMSHKAYENYCIKYFTTDYNIEEYFDHILNSVLAHKSTSFNYYMMLENLWKSTAERINHYKTLQLGYKSSDDILNTPVLFLGAGPSLGDNIEWVKEYQDKFIIVAMGATYKLLVANGITPNIITTLDPQYGVLNKKHFDTKNVKKIGDCYVIAAMNTDQRILDRFNQEKLFMYEMAHPLHRHNLCYKGFSVGEITASILLGLGFKSLYLLGIDFAINQKTGETHTSDYRVSDEYENMEEKKHKEYSDSFSFKEELITVKGNLLEKVYSNRLFIMSLNAMGTNIEGSKKTFQNIYNLSNHGAYISSTQALNISDVNLSKFPLVSNDQLEKKLELFLISMSEDKLLKEDQFDIVKELKYLEDLEKKIEDMTLDKSKDFSDFQKRVEVLVELVFFPKVYCSFLHVVFVHFFNLMLQYIYYCFNNQSLKNEKENIEQVESIFLKQLQMVLHKYIYYLEKI